jgi:Rod binding domain-containing protein
MDASLSALAPSADMLTMKSKHALGGNAEARLSRLHGGRRMNEAQIDETAKEFEAVFISQMLEHMFAGIEVNELFGGGHGEEMYQSMVMDEYGKLMAKAGGIGLADHVRREMLTLQEVE